MEVVEKLRKCIRCRQSKVVAVFRWGYHFEPGENHSWCLSCQMKTGEGA